jgi:MoaD family protein
MFPSGTPIRTRIFYVYKLYKISVENIFSVMIKSNCNNAYTSRTKKLVRLVRLMTVQVRVLFHAMFKEIAGTREITQELNTDSTLGEVLEELAKKYGKDFKTVVDPKTGQISSDTLVMLNGQSVRKVDTQLKDGDVIMISVPVGGG